MRIQGWMLLAVFGLVIASAGGAAEPSSEPVAVITQAIRGKGVLTFVYHGKERTVEPHALGKTPDGKVALLGWQTAGGSNTEPPPGWRTFLVGEITGLKQAGKTFAKPREDYRTQNPALKTVDAEVAL